MPDDIYKAYCKLCNKIFSVAGKGEGCVKDHAEGDNHKRLERDKNQTLSLHSFFASMYY